MVFFIRDGSFFIFIICWWLLSDLAGRGTRKVLEPEQLFLWLNIHLGPNPCTWFTCHIICWSLTIQPRKCFPIKCFIYPARDCFNLPIKVVLNKSWFVSGAGQIPLCLNHRLLINTLPPRISRSRLFTTWPPSHSLVSPGASTTSAQEPWSCWYTMRQTTCWRYMPMTLNHKSMLLTSGV